MSSPERCPRCEGSGTYPETHPLRPTHFCWQICTTCKGTGEVKMSSPERTARERFTEAQRKMWKALTQVHSLGYYITHESDMRQAVEAFQAERCLRLDGGQHTGPDDCKDELAALLKEVGLDD